MRVVCALAHFYAFFLDNVLQKIMPELNRWSAILLFRL